MQNRMFGLCGAILEDSHGVTVHKDPNCIGNLQAPGERATSEHYTSPNREIAKCFQGETSILQTLRVHSSKTALETPTTSSSLDTFIVCFVAAVVKCP